MNIKFYRHLLTGEEGPRGRTGRDAEYVLNFNSLLCFLWICFRALVRLVLMDLKVLWAVKEEVPATASVDVL